MKRALTIVLPALFAIISLTATTSAVAQQQTYSPLALQRQRQMQRRAQSSAVVAPLYQRQDTWYEFLLKQFNPKNFDYGAWMEERRRVFLEASVENPYFNYCSGLTIALIVMAMVYTKQRIDHKRLMWVTADMMTDLYNHDLYSRDVAKNAIQKYNAHIERCNRAIEAAEHGGAITEGDRTEADELRAKVLQQAGEIQAKENTIAQLDQALRRKEDMIVELSVRMDALAARTGNKDVATQPVDLRGSDAKLMQLVNNLQEQVYVAEEKNKRLKGA